MSQANSNEQKASSRRARRAQSGKAISVKTQKPQAQKRSAPVAQATTRRMPKANIRSVNDGDIRVRHREYIGEIGGAVDFEARQHAVNPGLISEFPWLSKIAQRFESYRFNRLRYCFETEAPTSTTGSVMGVLDYDPSDPAPVNKVQAMAYRNSVRSPPWADFCMDSASEDLNKRKSYFVRSGTVTSDISLFDTGNFFLCVQGQASTAIIGELYVEYDVTLMTPQLGDPGWDHALWGQYTGLSNASPFGIVAGDLPATVSFAGTTTSVTTWSFRAPWEGFWSIYTTGTTLTGPTAGGTCDFTSQATLINSGNTATLQMGKLKAEVGQTFTMTIPNASVTSARANFGQGDPV